MTFITPPNLGTTANPPASCESKRYTWIDLAKVLTMLLVVYDYLGLENRDVAAWIWTFHMPVFFLISGMFFSTKRSLGEQIKKDLKHLLLPLLLWHIIASLTWSIANTWYFGGDDKIG